MLMLVQAGRPQAALLQPQRQNKQCRQPQQQPRQQLLLCLLRRMSHRQQRPQQQQKKQHQSLKQHLQRLHLLVLHCHLSRQGLLRLAQRVCVRERGAAQPVA